MTTSASSATASVMASCRARATRSVTAAAAATTAFDAEALTLDALRQQVLEEDAVELVASA